MPPMNNISQGRSDQIRSKIDVMGIPATPLAHIISLAASHLVILRREATDRNQTKESQHIQYRDIVTATTTQTILAVYQTTLLRNHAPLQPRSFAATLLCSHTPLQSRSFATALLNSHAASRTRSFATSHFRIHAHLHPRSFTITSLFNYVLLASNPERPGTSHSAPVVTGDAFVSRKRLQAKHHSRSGQTLLKLQLEQGP